MAVDDPPGAYVLIVDLESDALLKVGKRGEFSFPAGTYAYVGSAMRGLSGRLGRHMDPMRKTHWHIDHLTKRGETRGAYLIPSSKRQECEVAFDLAGAPGSTPFCPGFGCSDCHCPTHLFLVDRSSLRHLDRRYGRMKPASTLVRESRGARIINRPRQ